MPASATISAAHPPNLRGVRSLRSSLVSGVWGDPGVGKTHWVEALLRESAISQLRVSARITVSNLAQRIAAVGKPRPLWLERRLQDVLGGRFAAPKDLAEFVAALLALSAPLALHVEDLHAADAESLAFWVALAGFVQRSKGVALIATSRRPIPAPFDGFRLEPLSQAASDVLLSQTLNADLPLEALGWLWACARGNVLFGLEYLRFATRQGWLWSDGQRWRWRAPSDLRPPTSLEGLVMRLLETAAESPEAMRLLEALTVLPDGVSNEVWRAATGLRTEHFTAALEMLERHGVILNNGYAHRLYREVMLERLDASQTQALALPALELLLTLDDPSAREAAVKLLDFARVSSETAFALLLHASRDAAQSGDALRSTLLKARAVEFAAPSERSTLAIDSARALRSVRPAEALRLAQIAEASQIDLELRFLVAELLLLNGQSADADTLVRALGAKPYQLEWLPRLIALRVQQLDFAAALELWHGQTDFNPQFQQAATPLLRRDVAWAMIQFGELDAAEALLHSALALDPTPLERGALLMALAYQSLMRGDLGHAESFAGQAVVLLETSGASLDLARALEVRAEVLEHQGLSVQAVQLSARAVALRGELGDAWGVCRAQLRLSSALLELGEYEQSEELLLESRAVLERRDAREALIVWDCQLAHLYAEWNPAHGASLALRHARNALRLARERVHPTMLNTALAQAAWVEAWYGDPTTALALSDEALALAAELEQADQSGLETMARGAALEGLGRLEESLAAYQHGVTQLQAAGLASSERYALELDRLGADAGSAAKRNEIFVRRGQRHALNIAKRYFPALRLNAPTALEAQNLESPALELPTLELQVLGTLRVVRSTQDQQPMRSTQDQQPVRGTQVLRVQTLAGKALLALLLEARFSGRNEIPDLELMDRLFANLSEASARNALKNLVYRLRTITDPSAITRTPTGYALGLVASDAERFLASADLRLWRGAYLEDLSELGARGELRHALLLGLHEAIADQIAPSPALAVRAARALRLMEPYEASGLRALLGALRASNNRRDLVRAYQAARTDFAEVGVALPDSWQAFLDRDEENLENPGAYSALHNV